MSNYVTKKSAKPCCAACAGGSPALGSTEQTKSVAVYGILVVGGLLWLMRSVGR